MIQTGLMMPNFTYCVRRPEGPPLQLQAPTLLYTNTT